MQTPDYSAQASVRYCSLQRLGLLYKGDERALAVVAGQRIFVPNHSQEVLARAMEEQARPGMHSVEEAHSLVAVVLACMPTVRAGCRTWCS